MSLPAKWSSEWPPLLPPSLSLSLSPLCPPVAYFPEGAWLRVYEHELSHFQIRKPGCAKEEKKAEKEERRMSFNPRRSDGVQKAFVVSELRRELSLVSFSCEPAGANFAGAL